MKQSDQINELAAALSAAQGALRHAAKDSSNPFFKSSYADLASCWEACREPLTKNKLAVSQAPEMSNWAPLIVAVTTRLMHASGQWLETTVSTPVHDRVDEKGKVHKADAQGIGSAITYLRRYSLCAMVGISPDDDDGNTASGNTATGKQSKAEKATKAPADWREVAVHFGKYKDRKLGEMDQGLLEKWTAWQPKPWKGKIKAEDAALRKALDEAATAMRSANRSQNPAEMSQAEKDAVMEKEVRDAERE